MTKALENVIALCRQAGEVILKYYAQGAPAQTKDDGSPVTMADLNTDRLITQGLIKSFPGIPIISEESGIPDYQRRKGWKKFWLVDPLDGTKEFLNRNGDFTVNVALIEEGQPQLGVILAPAKGSLYYAAKGAGSWKQESTGKPRRIFSRPADPKKPLVIVESRSHGSQKLDLFLQGYQVARRIQVGSSLKFCLVAQGSADLYPRFGPTMEWDVAAGDCIYRNSGRTAPRPSSLTYNKPDLRNADFVLGF